MALKRKSSDDLENLGSNKVIHLEEDSNVNLESEGEEDEEDDDKLYCICRMPNDESKPMIACDDCDEWYHASCMGIDEDDIESLTEWNCGRCNGDVTGALDESSNHSQTQSSENKKKLSPEDLQQAMSAVKDGDMTIKEAAQTYKLSRTTLSRNLKRDRMPVKPKCLTLLTPEEEDIVVEHFKAEKLQGKRVFKREIKEFVSQLLEKRDYKDRRASEKGPGDHWFRNFYIRHPELKDIRPSEAPNVIVPGVSTANQPILHSVVPLGSTSFQLLPQLPHASSNLGTVLNNNTSILPQVVATPPNDHLRAQVLSMKMMQIHDAVIAANHRIEGRVLHTPLVESFDLQKLVNNKVYLKLESEQLTGSFKLRGAFNKLCKLQESDRDQAIEISPVAASSGNHGLACAYAMKKLGMSGTVYVPATVSVGKEEALKEAGVEVIKYGDDCVVSEREARNRAQEENREYISPYNDYDVIAGSGTVGFEILDDLPGVDCIIMSVGGGGLAAGISAYVKAEKPSCMIIGCQPENSKVMYESVKAGQIVHEESKGTLSDGTAGGVEANSVTFLPCKQFVDEYFLVSEAEIAKAIKFMVEKHHKIVEGAAAVCIAAYMKNAHRFRDKTVAIVICGANIDLPTLLGVLKS